jgi:hypothetical protein
MLSTHRKAIDHLMFGHEWCLEESKLPVTEPPQKGVRLQDQLERFSEKREHNQHK